MKKLLFVPLALCLVIAGCNAQQKATDVSNILNGILQIVKADIPALPPADQAAVTNWDNLGLTLNGQLNTCIAASGNTGSKLATCFTAFAAGLTSPAELSQLRISAGSQSKVELWATAAVIAVNTAMDYFNTTQVPMPTVAPAPSSSQVDNFRQQVMAYAR